MRIRHAVPFAALLLFAACEVPLAPKWNVDLFFPIKYPDVALSQYAGPGGVIPTTTVTFTTPADSDAVSDATRQIFEEDIDSLKAEVILANSANITGSMDISIAASRFNLFSTNPALAVTVTLPIRVTAGDTVRIPNVNTTLFQQAQALFTQTRGSMRAAGGAPIFVTANDKLSLGVDLTANVKFSK